jgi:hypothetical protein
VDILKDTFLSNSRQKMLLRQRQEVFIQKLYAIYYKNIYLGTKEDTYRARANSRLV